MTAAAIPSVYIWRRLHSLMGLWFLLFLIEHLLTNSQAALWLGDNGHGFVTSVNFIHNLPYLEVIELTLLGVPIFIHMVWGVKYLFTSKFNSGRTDGSAPSMRTGRNRAYTWQRITSWILLFGVIGHVTKFRFLEYPDKVHVGNETVYLSKINMDTGLYTLADRLNVKLYDACQIAQEQERIDWQQAQRAHNELVDVNAQQAIDPITGPVAEDFSAQQADELNDAQHIETQAFFVEALGKQRLAAGQVVAVAKDFGTASLLAVRNTFKNPIYIGLYTIFVLAACFHACNGFWTFLLTWGWILKMAAQRAWVSVSIVMMAVLIFLGLAAVWGTYWANLRY